MHIAWGEKKKKKTESWAWGLNSAMECLSTKYEAQCGIGCMVVSKAAFQR